MTPPPLLRTKSFWLGLIILLGIAGAWLDTAFHETTLTYAGPTRAWQINRLDSATLLVSGSSAKIAAVPGWEFVRGANTSDRKDWEGFQTLVGSSHLTIHDAAVFFLLLVAWLGWLSWRARKRSPAGATSL
ncbi:hypothetical protein [Luteolibacter soli]|uniref:Uncharacterized protein n=1 Tax=Luteolibacter soli TaxID=3135280 RepID=A0ABU9AVZ4_9BACT